MFKPQLAPNKQPDLNELNYPLFASTKLDGIRCIFYKGQILSRSLKQIQCKQLRGKLEPLRKYSEDNNLILDGEIYGHGMSFQEITHFVMTKDLEESKTVKKNGGVISIPEELKFYCFDAVKDDNFDQPFNERVEVHVEPAGAFHNDIMYVVIQNIVKNAEEVNEYFEDVLEDGFEGLILKSIDGRYKCGRGTLKEGLIFKVKPYKDIDARIKGVVQATKVDPNAEKTINELNRSVTSKKKEDRILIEKASAFTVDYEGKDVKVVIALPDVEKEEIWKNKEKYVGRMIEYKYLEVGMKEGGLPRHPVFLRWRIDKE